MPWLTCGRRDHPADTLYWHNMLQSHKQLCKELSDEEHHASTYMAPHHVAAPGVYDELTATYQALAPRRPPKPPQPAVAQTAPVSHNEKSGHGSHH
jgi:hypothetical protein